MAVAGAVVAVAEAAAAVVAAVDLVTRRPPTIFGVEIPQRPPSFLASQCPVFVSKKHDSYAFEPFWVWTHKRRESIQAAGHSIENDVLVVQGVMPHAVQAHNVVGRSVNSIHDVDDL